MQPQSDFQMLPLSKLGDRIAIDLKEHFNESDFIFEHNDPDRANELGVEIRIYNKIWDERYGEKRIYLCINSREENGEKCYGFKHGTLHDNETELSEYVEKIRNYARKHCVESDNNHWPLWFPIDRDRVLAKDSTHQQISVDSICCKYRSMVRELLYVYKSIL